VKLMSNSCIPFEKQPWEMTREEFLQRLKQPVYPKPTKPDHVVLFTVTTPDAAKKISCEGLRTEMATGREGPANVLFATTGPTEYAEGGTLVAFQYPEELARQAGPPWSKLVYQDVPAEDILAVYPESIGGGGNARLDLVLKYTAESGYGEEVHEFVVKEVVAEGRCDSIPPEVLAEYPDLHCQQ